MPASTDPPDALAHFDRVAAVLTHRPFGLLSDLDGTLSPIAPTPDAASVPESIRAALARLTERVDLLALVSGRPAGEVAAELGLPQAVIFGNHGFESWRDGRIDRPPDVQPFQARLAELVSLAQSALRDPGIEIEDKTVTASIHYRESPRPEAARRQILDWLGPVARARGLVVTEGRRVVEVRPPLGYNKGTAVNSLIRDNGLRGVIYLGDDRTDLDAFRVLIEWRRSPDNAGLTVAVRSDEMPPELAEAADLSVAGPTDLEELLRRLGDALEPKTPTNPG